MSGKHRVIVEVKYGTALHNAALRNIHPRSADRVLDAKVLPKAAGITWDTQYGPVQLPGLVPLEVPRSARDVGDLFRLAAEPQKSTYLLRGSIDSDEPDGRRRLMDANPNIVGIYADVAIQPCRICPGDPALGNDAMVGELLGVDRLKTCGMDGTGVLVAIVDTGINVNYLATHGKTPGFDATRSWAPPSAYPGFVPGDAWVDHGTMCAFDVCIAAPHCTLLDIAVLQSNTPGWTIMEGVLSDAVLAYSHLLSIMLAPYRPGARPSLVVSNSWGMFHPSWDYPIGDPGNYSDNPDHPFNRIVGALERCGADIVFAAGNCGADCPDGRCEGLTTMAIYGANSHPQAISVAGVDISQDRVGYSAIGPGRLAARKPDICGYTHFRGSGVYAADGGTSAACPTVAGVVAALRSVLPSNPADPSTSPAAVRDIITKTAIERGAIGYDYEYGWGIINGAAIADRLCPVTEPKGEPEPEPKVCCYCCCHEPPAEPEPKRCKCCTCSRCRG